jgi:predicted nucleic acid-binding protein
MGPGLTSLLFDSMIVIDALNGHRTAVEELLAPERGFISRVTWIEVLAGCRVADTERRAREVLSNLLLLEIDRVVSEQAAVIRRMTRLKLPDAIILATARVHGLTLSTRNTRDFPEDDPSVRIPYRL